MPLAAPVTKLRKTIFHFAVSAFLVSFASCKTTIIKMENNTILFVVLCIALLAVAGRVIINRQNSKGIAWRKMAVIFGAFVLYISAFMLFNPQRFALWYKGEATLADARRECISGRAGAPDITRINSTNDIDSNLYFVLVAKTIEPTGYYKLKDSNERHNSTKRNIETAESAMQMIERKTSVFDITRSPRSNADKYLTIYKVGLADGKSVLACMEDYQAQPGELPVGMVKESNSKMQSIAIESDSLTISEFYFNLFNEIEYQHNSLIYIIYKAIFGIIVMIPLSILYLYIKRKRKTA